MIARTAVAAFIAAGLAAGCGPRSVGKSPSWRDNKDGKGGGIALKAGEPIVLEPATRGSAQYNARELGEAPHSELGDALVAAVTRAAEGAGRTAPVSDPRLFAVAQDLAPVATESAPIPYGLVEFALRHHGIIEPSPHIILIWGPLDQGKLIADQLGERLPAIFADNAIARVGVGAEPRGDTGVILLVLQPSFIETDPIPRVVKAGGSVDIAARIESSYRDPEVFITHEDGTVSNPATKLGTDGRLQARISCEGRTGAQQIEITAADEDGSAVLANFPIWCGEQPPATASVTPTEAAGGPVTNAADAEEVMLALVNRDRADAKLPPLTLDTALSDVARKHSDEMRATGNVAHVSPTTGSAADRVRAGGIVTALVLENVARAYGISEAEQGLMNSPGHRANILSREATHIGIGIALGDSVTGHRELFVTQVFTRVPPKIVQADAARSLAARVVDASALAADDDLTTIASRFAEDIAAGRTNEEAAKRSSKALDKLARQFARVTTIVNPVADIDAFPVDVVNKDAKMTSFGVGIAQGKHEVIGDGAIFVVILVGEKR
jgi:uncharacterized protein YkwD